MAATTSQSGWTQIGNCRVFIPEGYTGPLDAIVYCAGSGGGKGADSIPYREIAKENPDRIIVYSLGVGGSDEKQIVSILQGINAEGGDISVGTIDVNGHSSGDKGAISQTVALDEAGFTVGSTNIFDGDSTLHMCAYGDYGAVTKDTWMKFEQTGAQLNVFSRGKAVNTSMEKDRLQTVASRFGIPATYTICDFEGNKAWDELHAATNRDLVANGFMDVIDGKTDSVSFTVKLTSDDYSSIAPRAAYVSGFISSESYNPETGEWTVTYTQAANGDDYSGMFAALSRNSSLYQGGAQLAATIAGTNNQLDQILTQLGTLNMSGAFGSLPSRDNLLVYKDELSAFLGSPSLSALTTDVDDSNKLNSLLSGFVGNTVLKGDIWNLAYQKIGLYDTRLNERIQVAVELESTLRNAVTQLLGCMGEYAKLDTSNLDELKQLSDNLQKQIDYLNQQIQAAGKDDDISGLLAALARVQKDKEEVDKEIRAIELLQQTYDQVRPSIEAAIEKVSSFGNTISSITPSQIYTYVA